MMIPQVPFQGRMSYCLIKCLQMNLSHQGHDYPLAWLECVSGEPFGFVYVQDPARFFAVNGYAYHLAGEHLLQTLHYAYTYTGANDEQEALSALNRALDAGPIVAGMLDMGYLTYIPDHHVLLGSDHAVVVLALQSDRVIIHDPDGYVAVPLPLNDFLAGWQRDIYTGKPYGLWQIGAQGTPPTQEEIWEQTLACARANFARVEESYAGGGGPTFLYGPEAIQALATDLPSWPERDLGGLTYFSWRVSGQRCLDSSFFLQKRLPEAAAIRWEECQMYGQLQQASAAKEYARLPDLLKRLAEYEARFIAALL